MAKQPSSKAAVPDANPEIDSSEDAVKNIKKMYSNGDGHVHVLAASIRSVDQLLASFAT